MGFNVVFGGVLVGLWRCFKFVVVVLKWFWTGF